jgi:hypothetical protein
MGIEYAILKHNFSLLDGDQNVRDQLLAALETQNTSGFFECNRRFVIENKYYTFEGYVEDYICFVRMQKNQELNVLNQMPVGIQSVKNHNHNHLFNVDLERKNYILGAFYQRDKRLFKKISNQNFNLLIPLFSAREMEEIEKAIKVHENLKKSQEMICIIDQSGEILFMSREFLQNTDGSAKYFSSLVFQLKNKLLFDESMLVLEEKISKEAIISNWEGEKFKLKFYNLDQFFYLILEPMNLIAHVINERNDIEYIKHQILSRIDNPVIIGKEKVEFSNYSLVLKGEDFHLAQKKISGSFKVHQFSLLNGKTIVLGLDIFKNCFDHMRKKIMELVPQVKENILKNHLQFLVFEIISEFDILLLNKKSEENASINIWKEFNCAVNHFCEFATIKNLNININRQHNIFCDPYILKTFINFLLIECFKFQFKNKELYSQHGKKTSLYLSIKKITSKEKSAILSRLEKFSEIASIYFSEKENDIVIGLEFENLN